jgi:hypothetical protein
MQFKGTCMPVAGLGDWSLRALCREVDPELFFPPRGVSCPEAVRVCRGCPVRVECLTEALAADEQNGIRAGLSERERRRLVRRRDARRAARSAGNPAQTPVPAPARVSCLDAARRRTRLSAVAVVADRLPLVVDVAASPLRVGGAR